MSVESQRKRIAKHYTATLNDVTKIVVRRRINGSPHKIGDDVTDVAKGWRNLRSMIRQGYLTTEPPMNYRAVPPFGYRDEPKTKDDEPADTDSEEVGNDNTTVPNDEYIPELKNGLRDISDSDTVVAIKEKLKANDVRIPHNAKKSELLAIAHEKTI